MIGVLFLLFKIRDDVNIYISLASFNLEAELHYHRSSHRRCSMKKGVLRNFTKFTGKHLCQSLFFNKVVGLRPFHHLFLQNTSGGCFYEKFRKIHSQTSAITHKTLVKGSLWVAFLRMENWLWVDLFIGTFITGDFIAKFTIT